MRLHRLLKEILRNRDGASTVEYGMILAFIVLAMFAVLQGLAGQTVGMWNSVSSKSAAAMSKN
ncbi:Flp family type IVb pilin [Novosphingobium kaempferiae]|uniref:Flp family type IVb pilin n=1 Tax=Novosphingobium kaempferiae TaxID=2896849 RepID=UPI001E2B0107|nr:Flp family type IVb pilin [Novosphingobium kaempferiae]